MTDEERDVEQEEWDRWMREEAAMEDWVEEGGE